MKVKVINNSKNTLPEYKTTGAAGMDLHANLDADLTLQPLERILVPTGLFMKIPFGYEAQVRPRSGLAYKKGLTVANAPGTIDSDYRGELKVILINLSNEEVTITDGERVAQLVIAKHEVAEWELVESLEESTRGAGGFGHTGKE